MKKYGVFIALGSAVLFGIYINSKADEEVARDVGGSRQHVDLPMNKPLAEPPAYTDPTTGMEFVYVKEGCFEMGDVFGVDGDYVEKPVHPVCVESFWMGKHEVTQGEWQKVMENNPSRFKKGSSYPVEDVSWNDTQSFIDKLNWKSGKGYRLPTEAEWEYAAREGGRRVRFGTGKDTIGADEANFDASDPDTELWSRVGVYRASTVAVGSFAPNGLGLYDLSGNVYEWCLDRYGPDYYRHSSRYNPRGPSSGSDRVVRGGCWAFGPWGLRVANRDGLAPGSRDDALGFRLVLPGKRP